MAVYTAHLTWTRGDQDFLDRKYSRAHSITFDGGVEMPASSSPHVVKLPLSREDAVDPEEMLVASLSSCHMLFFLDFASRAGFRLNAYVDDPIGEMGKDERGRIFVSRVTLKPTLWWDEAKQPTPEEIRELHHKSHEACFIANSFRGDITIAGGEAN